MFKNKNVKEFFNYLFEGIIYSYSQIFFSNKKWFGLLLILFTLINPFKTFIGITSVVIALVAGVMFNFNKELLRNGIYTYNGLLVGIGIASLYKFSTFTGLVIIFYSLLSLFLSVWFHNSFANKGLPFLTIPFLICIWMVHISDQAYGSIENNEIINEVFIPFKYLSDQFNSVIDWFPLSDLIRIFLKSTSAIFFIYNELIGFLILSIIFFYSRISFTLTILGFSIGALFFNYFLGDYSVLILGYIGFNFILIAIALGGFFIIPSIKSYLLQFFSIMLCCIIIGSISPIFWSINAPVYSLPFVLVILICLSALKLRLKAKGLELVINQQSQPEQNLYKNYYDKLRFKAQTHFHVYLPVLGEWTISQGINGGITHLDYWKYAWDFDIRTSENKTYQNLGTNLKDFLAYDVPVIAPVSGYVVNILDNIPDNEIGQVNTNKNWGNSLVIKISDNFYVQLSHFKMNSFKVALGEYVYVGQVLGMCGNSGRSPEPHLHFQMQLTQDIGSKTIKYPIAYYLAKTKGGVFKFYSFDYPKENQIVKNIIPDPTLQSAFNFTPNHTIKWEIKKEGKSTLKSWMINVDGFNKSYLFDTESNSYAYFKNDGILFYFYDFIGDKNSELFLFYLGCQKILLAAYKNILIKDWILPTYVFPELSWIQDFIAPFTQPLKGKFRSEITDLDSQHYPKKIEINSVVSKKIFNNEKDLITTTIFVHNKKINQLKITKKNQIIELICLNVLPI